MAEAKRSALYQLKIALTNIEPPIWRRVQSKDCTLLKLNEIVQVCMGWEGYHLWAFEINGEQYGDDSEGAMDMASARKVKLSQLAAAGVKKFRYIYDFGDNWEHDIRIEKMLEPAPNAKYPLCLEGSRACPPEDCGGSWGYSDFVEAIRNPKHDQHEELLEWVGGEFDPEAFDLAMVSRELAAMR